MAANIVCGFRYLLHANCTLFEAYLLQCGEVGIVRVCNNNNRTLFIRCISDILRRAYINGTVKYFFTEFLVLLREGVILVSQCKPCCLLVKFLNIQLIFLPKAQHPPSGSGPPHYQGFTITLRHTTVGRTPLDG